MVYSFRMKCPSCGQVSDVAANGACPKCGCALQTAQPGLLKIYRMGNFIGSAVGYGIYLNEVPFGHVGDRETVNIPLPFGTYKLHMTAGMTRKCNDLTFTIAPEDPVICVKAHIRMGVFTNTIIVERVDPSTMPS